MGPSEGFDLRPAIACPTKHCDRTGVRVMALNWTDNWPMLAKGAHCAIICCQ